MTRALPPSSAAAPRRANPLVLLLGGVVAGFGLGALLLALTLPTPRIESLPPVVASSEAAADTPPEPVQGRVWAAAFGLQAPEPEPVMEDTAEMVPEEDPYLEDDDYEDIDTETEYRLRGMVTEDEGGWALIEGDMGIEVVRVGSVLSGGESVIEITDDGVILQGYGAEFLLSFSDFDDEYQNEDTGFDGADDGADDGWFER